MARIEPLPRPIRWLEVALIIVLYVTIKLMMAYYWSGSKIEKARATIRRTNAPS